MKRIISIFLMLAMMMGSVAAYAEMPVWAQYDGGIKYFAECPAMPDPRSFVDNLFAFYCVKTDISGNTNASGYTSYGYMLNSESRTISDVLTTYYVMLSYAGFRVTEKDGKYTVYNGDDMIAAFAPLSQDSRFSVDVYDGFENLTSVSGAAGQAVAAPTEAPTPAPIPDKYCKDGKQCLIIDEKDVRIYLTGNYRKTDTWILVEVIVENNTNNNLWITYEGNVNGWSVGGIENVVGTHFLNGVTCSPHSKLIAQMPFDYKEGSLKRIGFSRIEELDTLQLTYSVATDMMHKNVLFEANTGLVHLHAK